MASYQRTGIKSVQIKTSIWVNGMPVEAAPTNDTRVIISHTEGEPKREKTGWRKWLLPAAFIGMSAFALVGQLIDILQVVGTPLIMKFLLPFLAGAAAALATSHSGLFQRGRGK